MLHWRQLESDVGLWIGESIAIRKTPEGYTCMHKLGWKFCVASLTSLCDCSWDGENLIAFWLICIPWVISSLQVAQNITTNELTNAMRYSYLKGPDGHFHNPYDHGCRKNCSDFLIQGYKEDIEVLKQPLQHNGGVHMLQLSGHSNVPSSSSVVSSNGSAKHQHHHHQHASSSRHNNHEHSSKFVPLGLGLGLDH